MCTLKLLCPANQGTANGNDGKNCFKSLVQDKASMFSDARTLITVSTTPLNFLWKKLGFAYESCPVLSLRIIKWSYFRQQHTTEAAFQMNIQPCSKPYFDITFWYVITEWYWNKCVDRKGLGDIAAFNYGMYDKYRSVSSYVNQSGWMMGRKTGRLIIIFTSI